MKNAAKCVFARYRSCSYSRERASESSSGDDQNASQHALSGVHLRAPGAQEEHLPAAPRQRAAPGRRRGLRTAAPTPELPISGKILAKFRSFSAVPAPIFASKHALGSIFQNLPDYLAESFEIWQKFVNFATIAKILLIFKTDFC